MARPGSTWIVILRCYSCRALFTLKGIPAIAIKAVNDASHCPKCGSKQNPATALPNRHAVVMLEKPRIDA